MKECYVQMNYCPQNVQNNKLLDVIMEKFIGMILVEIERIFIVLIRERRIIVVML